MLPNNCEARGLLSSTRLTHLTEFSKLVRQLHKLGIPLGFLGEYIGGLNSIVYLMVMWRQIVLSMTSYNIAWVRIFNQLGRLIARAAKRIRQGGPSPPPITTKLGTMSGYLQIIKFVSLLCVRQMRNHTDSQNCASGTERYFFHVCPWRKTIFDGRGPLT